LKLKSAAHVAPQLIPAGAEITVPVPLPFRATVKVNCWNVKTAVTPIDTVIVTVHGPVPLQLPPVQPANVEPAAGVAVSVTTWPKGKSAMHVAPQLMPGGDEVTVPPAAPAFVTVSVRRWSVKPATTSVAAVIVVVHVPVPLQPPPVQPVNVEPVAGVAVSVTAWLKLKSAAHVAPQLIPAGDEITVPVPLPFRVTVSVNRWSVKVAVTPTAAVIVVSQIAVPVQPPPDQPVKVEPAAGVAVSVTMDPKLKAAAHVAPQSMPAGTEATVPVPLPARVTTSELSSANDAVTSMSAVIVTLHGPVPMQSPDQPMKVAPTPGVAVNVTVVPSA